MGNYYENIRGLKATILSQLTGFLKHIVLVASAILGVIAALAAPPVHNIHLFYAVVALALLTIVAATAALYIAIIQLRTLSRDYTEQAIEQYRAGNTALPAITTSRHDKAALALERISLLLFLLMMIALAWYSFLIV